MSRKSRRDTTSTENAPEYDREAFLENIAELIKSNNQGELGEVRATEIDAPSGGLFSFDNGSIILRGGNTKKPLTKDAIAKQFGLSEDDFSLRQTSIKNDTEVTTKISFNEFPKLENLTDELKNKVSPNNSVGNIETPIIINPKIDGTLFSDELKAEIANALPNESKIRTDNTVSSNDTPKEDKPTQEKTHEQKMDETANKTKNYPKGNPALLADKTITLDVKNGDSLSKMADKMGITGKESQKEFFQLVKGATSHMSDINKIYPDKDIQISEADLSRLTSNATEQQRAARDSIIIG